MLRLTDEEVTKKYSDFVEHFNQGLSLKEMSAIYRMKPNSVSSRIIFLRKKYSQALNINKGRVAFIDEADKGYFRKDILLGLTPIEISKKYNASESAVFRYTKRERTIVRSKRDIVTSRNKMVVNKFKDGCSIEELCRNHKISRTETLMITLRARKLLKNIRNYRVRPRSKLVEVEQAILSKRKNYIDIAKKFGVTLNQVSYLAKRMTKTGRKHHLWIRKRPIVFAQESKKPDNGSLESLFSELARKKKLPFNQSVDKMNLKCNNKLTPSEGDCYENEENGNEVWR